MLSVKEQMLKENLIRVLGDRPETDMIFRSKTGRISQQEIDEYEMKRDEETQHFKTLFEFDKPILPSVFKPEPNQSLILSDLILKDKPFPENDNNSIRGSEDKGNETTLPLNKEQ